MAQPPDTVIEASRAEADEIRRAIRNVTTIETPYGTYRPAEPADADALFELLSDDRVSGPLYTIPKPVTREWVKEWIVAHEHEAKEGAGLLLLARDQENQPTGFVDIQLWPERSSAEMGGGILPDLQSASHGSRGAALLFDWLFNDIGVRLLAMTNALDNVRTEKLLRYLGYRRGVDRICVTADGGERPSMYWELKREDWRMPAMD